MESGIIGSDFSPIFFLFKLNVWFIYTLPVFLALAIVGKIMRWRFFSFKNIFVVLLSYCVSFLIVCWFIPN